MGVRVRWGGGGEHTGFDDPKGVSEESGEGT